jgi:hypothetical protein
VCQDEDVLYLYEFSTIPYDIGHVALRAKRDEKRTLPRSRDILHFLFGGQVV